MCSFINCFLTFLLPQTGVGPPPPVPAKPVTQTTNQTRLRLEDDEAMSDADDEEFKDAIDVAMTTEAYPLPVLPSQQLASSMGVSTHRVQVMKASFFGGTEDKSQGKQFSFGMSHSPIFHSTTTPSSQLSGHAPLRPSGSGRNTPIQLLSSRLQQTSGKSTPPAATPTSLRQMAHPAVSSLQAQAAVIMAKHNLCQLVPHQRSIVSGKTHNIADAGLVMGRSFRVGWGPNWTLAHSGFQISHSTDSKSFGLFSSGPYGGGEGHPLRVVVEQVNIKSPAKLSVPTKQVSNIYKHTLVSVIA